MRNRNNISLCRNFSLYLLGALLFFQISVFSQNINLTSTNTPGVVNISTTPSSPVSTSDGETSIGFFYRLEWETGGNKYSYFWSGSTLHSDELSLANNNSNYVLVSYELRKSGPIRTASKAIQISNSSITTNPSINLGTTSDLKLFNSWNIYTNQFPNSINPNPYHYDTQNSQIPNEDTPWVIMTIVKNSWADNTPITMSYPDYLAYKDAIFDNCMIGTNNCSPSLTITPYSASGKKYLSIQKNSSINGKAIIHVVFYKDPDYIAPIPRDVEFGVSYHSENSPIPDDTIKVEFKFDVKVKPHDPNHLEVDKKELCECGSDEYLIYRIDYQNDGQAPTNEVTVTLYNTTHLIESTIQYHDYSDAWNAPISQSINNPRQFIINYNGMGGLPGLKQNTFYPKANADECSDHFYIKVKKEDCLSAGTMIQPKAEIKFLGAPETIFTNLDETMIVSKVNCESCPPNPRCPTCAKKKTCWFLNLFKGKKRD